MAANVIEKLQEAIKACEEISAKDLKEQKEEIAKQFGELQKAVYDITDEKGVILANYTWKSKKTYTDNSFKSVLDAEAKRISMHTGYSEEVIREMLETENAYEWTKNVYIGYVEYEFLTIKI